MPFIVTMVHDPIALAATCWEYHAPPPQEGCWQLDAHEVFGWIVNLPGVHHPIVCNTLTGLVAYHASDNCFNRYAYIMSFLSRYYAVQARQEDEALSRKITGSSARQSRRSSRVHVSR
jgi:hypothetical protein